MASVPPPGFDQTPTARSPIQEAYSRPADDRAASAPPLPASRAHDGDRSITAADVACRLVRRPKRADGTCVDLPPAAPATGASPEGEGERRHARARLDLGGAVGQGRRAA
jgi:hypothetical protein